MICELNTGTLLHTNGANRPITSQSTYMINLVECDGRNLHSAQTTPHQNVLNQADPACEKGDGGSQSRVPGCKGLSSARLVGRDDDVRYDEG